MPSNPAYRKRNLYGPSGRPVFEPDAMEIQARAAECRETWTEADYLSRAGVDEPQPVEFRPVSFEAFMGFDKPRR